MDRLNHSTSAEGDAPQTPLYCPSCSAPVEEGTSRCGGCGLAPSRAGWPSDPLVGTVVGDKYRLRRRLGEGAFGVVYLADHVTFGAQRAVKVLHDRLTYDAQVVARFRREAQAIYRLTADAIVRLEDFGELRPGVPFMAMEYAEGEALSDLIEREAPLGLQRALGIARQIAIALVDAATQGILHRDLKPGNIRIHAHPRRGEEVKVLDFGIAKILSEGTITRTGDSSLGTPGYMAPELWQTGEIDTRADLFALGVIVYEMLTGALPWPVLPGEPLATLVAMRDREAPRINTMAPANPVPPAVEQLVAELLDTEATRRPQNATAVLRRIDEMQLLSTAAVVVESAPDRTVRMRPAEVAAVHDGTPDRLQAALSSAPTIDGSRVGSPATSGRDSKTEASERASGRHRELTDEELEVALGDTRPTPRAVRTSKEATDELPRSRLGLMLLLSALLLAAGGAGVVYTVGGWPFAGALSGSGEGSGVAPVFLGENEGSGELVVVPAALPAESAPEGMVYIPGGQAVLGQSPEQLSAQANDFGPATADYRFYPRERAFIAPFFIDRYEVPVSDYLQFQRELRRNADMRSEMEQRCPDATAARLPRENPRTPARSVSYYEAVMFCSARDMRLPTFREWERAARGDDGRRFPWGNAPGREGAFNAGASEQPPHAQTASVLDGFPGAAPVAAMAAGASPFGVEGMAGNVSEWVSGPDGSVDRPPFFHRGGNFLSHPLFLQTFAYQFVSDPCIGYETVGFRCAADAE